MAKLRTHRFRGIYASMLMAVFLASQVFSCCLVNQKLGHFLKTAFAAPAPSQTASHSCCPLPASGTPGKEKPSPDAAKHQGCCIQDANLKSPQIASEQIPVPVMPDQIIGVLALSFLHLQEIPARPELRSSSSPPVYLTQLRLLI